MNISDKLYDDLDSIFGLSDLIELFYKDEVRDCRFDKTVRQHQYDFDGYKKFFVESSLSNQKGRYQSKMSLSVTRNQ